MGMSFTISRTCTLINHCKEVEKNTIAEFRRVAWVNLSSVFSLWKICPLHSEMGFLPPAECHLTHRLPHIYHSPLSMCVCVCMHLTRKNCVHITSHREVVWPPAWTVSEGLLATFQKWRIEVCKTKFYRRLSIKNPWIVHPNILSSCTQSNVVPNLYDFLLQDTKVTKRFWWLLKKHWDSSQNIFFYVPQFLNILWGHFELNVNYSTKHAHKQIQTNRLRALSTIPLPY